MRLSWAVAFTPVPRSGRRPAGGRVAVMALVNGDTTASTTPWAGMFVDAWPERVPPRRESAGVAFHHDDPKARAPQALLLAACPDLAHGWDDATLAQVLRETLALARVRTVDLASVGQVGQVLPALYFPFNLQEDTVSMILSPIAAIVTSQAGQAGQG